MTTLTLAQFAKALDAVRAKYPDAPGLPEGYRFDGRYTRPEPVALWFEDAADNRVVPDAAALALLICVAMEVGAWWERNTTGTSHISYQPDYECWMSEVWPDEKDVSFAKPCPSLPSAALAMLEVIGGGR